jgi:hypothetical protein
MPSTLVHVAFGGLIAAGLLGGYFDRRALAVVLAAAAFPDADTVLGIWIRGGHRTLLHTLVLPTALALALFVDGRRERPLVRGRWGPRGVRVAWVAVATLALGGIGPDLFTNGVNALYPFHDQFYRLSGKAVLSNQRGFVQTFVELGGEGGGGGGSGSAAVGSTAEVHYSTGADPTAGADPQHVERVFPLVYSGTQLLVVLTSAIVVGGRLRIAGRDEPEA